MVHSQDTATRMVAVNVLYDVGSRDEHPDHTGFAHLFEHLMFGGTAHIPDFDIPMQRSGGEGNAFTNNDVTNFYSTLPAHHIETAFWMESDRMMSLDLSPRSLEVQRSVVMEEYKQRVLNLPYGDVTHLLLPLAYQAHPYRWPVIGRELSHIANATLDEVKAFYSRFYNPGRAILAVTGNVEWDEVISLAEKWFGEIPAGPAYQRNMPKEPKQTVQRRLEVSRPVTQDALYMSFHSPDCMHPDLYVCDVLSDILSNGDSSRLRQRLVHEQKVFSAIDAPLTGTRDAGLLDIKGKLASGVTLPQAEEAVWKELRLLMTQAVDEYELQKVKNKYESVQTFGRINYQRLAFRLAWFELNGKAELIDEELEKYQSVSQDQLLTVAGELFREDNASVLYYAKQ